MASPYKSTAQTTNAARVSRVVMGPCTDLFRDVLRHFIPETDFQSKLSSFQGKVKTLVKGEQRNMLYPLNGVCTAKYEDFDISLLYLLIRNMCGITPHSRGWGFTPITNDRSLSANLDRLRQIRNKYCGHSPQISLSNVDFSRVWSEVRQTVQEIELHLTGVSTNFTNEIDFLKTETMDPEQDKNYLAWKTQQKKVLGEWQQQEVRFYRTKACQEAEKKIKSSNTLTISGNSGSGKTAIAQHIALLYQKVGFQIIAADSFKNIKNKMNPEEKQMFVLNDPVGKESLDEMSEKKIKQHEDSMWSKIKNSEIKLVFTCRNVVLNDKRLRCKLLTSSTLDVDGEKLRLSEHEKKGILGKHVELSNIEKDELSKILKTDSYFPLLCSLFGNNAKYRVKGSGFFKGFASIVKEEVQDFKISDKGKFCALILLSFYENGLEEELLTDIKKKCNEIVQEVYEICGFERHKSRSFLLEKLSALEGSYVKKVGTLYRFLHDYMMEVTTFILGQTHPKYMIQHCPGIFLRNRLAFKTTQLNDKPNMDNTPGDLIVELNKNVVPVLVERFIIEIKTGNCFDPFLSPCFRHKSVILEFISKLDDNLREELMKMRIYERENLKLNENQGTFTKVDFFFMRTKASPLHLLLIYNFDSIVRALCDKVDKSKLCDYELFLASCASGNTDLIEYITYQLGLNTHKNWTGKFDPLKVAAVFNYENVIKFLLEREKCNVNELSKNWTPLMLASWNRFDNNEDNQNNAVNTLINNKADVNLCDSDGYTALHAAARGGHDSVVKILLDNKADINMCNNNGVSPLYIAAHDGHDSVVKILLDNKADVIMCNNNGASPLYIAAHKGHDSVVQILLDNKADVNMCNNKGVRPLNIAAQAGHDSVVKILLDNKADVNKCDNNSNSPLYIAAKNGYDSVVKILLDNKADVNMCNNNGASPLYIAAHKGHDSVVKILLDNKADVNMYNNNGVSPLYIAAQDGHDSVVKILLDNKADVNMCNNNGASPLYIAAHKGHDSVVQILLDNKADVNMCNNNGVSPVNIAAQDGHDSVVKILLDNKADVNKCDNNGNSPLYIAAYNGHESVVTTLLDNKADVNMCNNHHNTPLTAAAYYGQNSIVRTLLENKADVNMRDDDGDSSLTCAAHNGHVSIVKILLDNKADVNMCNNNGASPLYIAAQKGHDSVVQILLDNKADVNMCNNNGVSPLNIAAQDGHDSVVKILLDNKADVNKCDNNGNSPLYIAAYNGHESVVTTLLDNKADVNMCNNHHNTPLTAAAYYGQNSIVRTLLENKADVNMRDDDGDSSLTCAAHNGHVSIVKILLDNKADVNMCNNNGASPLYIAAHKGHDSVVKILLDNKADVNICNNNGVSPLNIAEQDGHDSVVKILLDNKADVNMCDNNGNSPLYSRI